MTHCYISVTTAALSPEVQSVLQQLDSGYEVVSHDVQLDYHHFTADAILRVRQVLCTCQMPESGPRMHEHTAAAPEAQHLRTLC